jgi:hypothetical protein
MTRSTSFVYSFGGYTGFPYVYALFFAFMSFEPAIDGCLIGTAQYTFNVSKNFVRFGSAVNGKGVTVAAGTKHHEVLFLPMFMVITMAVHVMHIDCWSPDPFQEVAEHTPTIITILRQHVLTLAVGDQFVLTDALGFDPIRLLRLGLRVDDGVVHIS